MNLDQEPLNEWAELLYRSEMRLESIAERLQTAGPADCLAELNLVRAHINRVKRGLVRGGADDPLESALASTREAMRAAGFEAPEPVPVPLHLLTSETNRRFYALLQQLLPIAVARDRERGWYPEGPAQAVAEMLADAQFEVNGPKGLEG